MKTSHILSPLFCIVLSAPMTSHAAATAATAPNKGFYHVESYITAAKPTATCSGFGIAVGPAPSGSLYYPGPSATGAILRYAGTKSATITAESFPKTPAAGATSWSGTLMQGTEPNLTFPIAFRAKLAPLDAQSFTIVATLTVTVGANKCTITQNIALTQTG